jgi:selenocysteine lyase/cysteine desulfurase
MTFDKSTTLFPVKKNSIYLLHCGIAPLYSRAFEKEREIAGEQQTTGARVFEEQYGKILAGLHAASAELLKTDADDIAFVKNTSEAISLIAGGYRFSKGDQVIVYTHEYPANFYPWKLQEERGAEVLLLPDADSEPATDDRPTSWSMSDLEQLITKKTKIVAVSHVQFTSGFAADLQKLGDFCASREIDLVVDVAQSLGALPVFPEQMHIAAVASSGWKWLLGPVGTGLMYTSPEFREKLAPVAAGAELMRQGTDYLDHSWNPHRSAKRFEYSTSPISLAAALEICLRDLSLRYGIENIRSELFRLQSIAVDLIDRDLYAPLIHRPENRSGILSVICKRNEPRSVVRELQKHDVVCSARGGYLRIAPHFYNTEDEIEQAVGALNSIGDN